MNIDKIITESINKILNEGKIEDWGKDEFVTWDEYQYYCGHSGDWVDRNRERSDKLGVPEDQRCGFCEKPLKGKYKIVYAPDFNDPDWLSAPNGYFAHPHPHMRAVKIGMQCAKAFEQAHKDKYGY